MNPEYEKKNKRTLEEVSHLFLSGADSPKETKTNPFILGAVDSLEECGLSLILSLAEKSGIPSDEVLLVDFHPETGPGETKLPEAFMPPRCDLIRLDPWEDWRQKSYNRQTKFVFLDIPWLSPNARTAAVSNLDGILFRLEPSLRCLKHAYRLLKGMAGIFHGRIFVVWKEGTVTGHLNSIGAAWSDLAERFLGKKIEWCGGIDSVLSVIGPRNFGSFEWSLFKDRMPLEETSAFFDKGKLAPPEIDAFSGLVSPERFSVLFPRAQ
ncbi:MAG TPA: hypothetical protein PKL97_04275 [Candidatus Omnitrophota bacterium]|nr:hypothetical protein [Candidatus Omnitrophota bacterium]